MNIGVSKLLYMTTPAQLNSTTIQTLIGQRQQPIYLIFLKPRSIKQRFLNSIAAYNIKDIRCTMAKTCTQRTTTFTNNCQCLYLMVPGGSRYLSDADSS